MKEKLERLLENSYSPYSHFRVASIAVMKDGKILELATSDELYNNPLHPYTISLLSASPLTDLYKERERKRIDYDPKNHKYPEGMPTGLFEMVPGHWVYCSVPEIPQYKELATRVSAVAN